MKERIRWSKPCRGRLARGFWESVCGRFAIEPITETCWSLKIVGSTLRDRRTGSAVQTRSTEESKFLAAKAAREFI